MRKSCVLNALGLGMIGAALVIAQPASAQDRADLPNYDTALRCAAVNTLISGVLGGGQGSDGQGLDGQGDSASAQDKAMAEHFDAMVQLWMEHAASLEGEDKALADYLERANALVDKAGKTQDEAEMEGLVGKDMALCSELEEKLLVEE